MSPVVRGGAIRIAFLPTLKARRGKLLWGGAESGREVHAASFLRQRRIVLDAALLTQPRELDRILVHELFHFVWLRLGNPRRNSWETVLRREIAARVPGELGWSAELVKAALRNQDRARRSRRWREYTCESFCDSAAFVFSGQGRHQEFTLPTASRRERRRWFLEAGLAREISV